TFNPRANFFYYHFGENIHMAAKKAKNNSDPVLPDQAGRLMAVDPMGTNAPQEQIIRRKAYEIYEQRGREDGNEVQHWLEAERELQWRGSI
ncbi:MAG: DUF2934 domain-containing protein, partial [Terriglobales bacterium]